MLSVCFCVPNSLSLNSRKIATKIGTKIIPLLETHTRQHFQLPKGSFYNTVDAHYPYVRAILSTLT